MRNGPLRRGIDWIAADLGTGMRRMASSAAWVALRAPMVFDRNGGEWPEVSSQSAQAVLKMAGAAFPLQ
jgi:hypothetical protein